MHVKKGDKVKIIAGKDKGHTGTVVKALPKRDKVVVEGAHLVKRHRRARHGGDTGQIVEKHMPMHVSNVKKVAN